jgi:hypothetical protein
VGINIGDVIVEAHDIFGDGVNIAARLEGVAEPGGICISQTVLNHARDKVSFEVEDAGEQTLKNIARPVHVYRIIIEPSRRPATPKPEIPALALPDKPEPGTMARVIAKASEQNLPPKIPVPPARPTATSTRKPMSLLPSPQATAQRQPEKTQLSSAPRAPMPLR